MSEDSGDIEPEDGAPDRRRDPSPWMQNDELFAAELRAGHKWAEKVGERLKACGFPVLVTPMKLRASIDEIAEYQNEFDIVVGDLNGRHVVIESKSRAQDFTEDPSSFPFRTAFVDTVSGWDAKGIKPKAVVLISQRTGSMLVVSVLRTRSKWTIKRTFDNVRKITDSWYEVPREDLVSMQVLIDWLRSGRWQTE